MDEATRAERFWNRVDRSGGPSACWPYRGKLDDPDPARGYGVLHIGPRSDNRTLQAHRYAYFLTHGAWPLICRHTCDTPPCCNPAHLIDGTQADNVRDRDERRRGRWHEGGANHRAVLGPELGVAILSEYEKGARQVDLAARFGVGQSTISAVVRRTHWSVRT